MKYELLQKYFDRQLYYLYLLDIHLIEAADFIECESNDRFVLDDPAEHRLSPFKSLRDLDLLKLALLCIYDIYVIIQVMTQAAFPSPPDKP